MAIYSVGRRRIIFAILLTCVMLLVLDRSGNAGVNRLRDIASTVIRPFDVAADVVSNPVIRAWRSYNDYDELVDENEALREEIDRLRGTQAAAQAAVRDYQELAALTQLPSLAGIETVVGQVISRSATNLDEIVEINKGSLSGIQVGMPVVNQAGLIGRVTSVSPTTSRIRLVTDREFSVPVELLVGSADAIEEAPTNTTPSGLTPDEVAAAATTTTTTTLPPVTGTTTPLDVFDDPELPETPAPDLVPSSTDVAITVVDPISGEILEVDPETGLASRIDPVTGVAIPIDPTTGLPVSTDPETGLPVTTDPDTGLPVVTDPATGLPVITDPRTGEVIIADTSTTTTTQPFVLAEKEFGILFGSGRNRVPQVRFVQDNPALTVLGVGDLVVTAGGSEALAPAGIPVGRVINRVDRPGVGGPLLEVDLQADVSRLNFVQVVIYRPLSEVGG